MTITDEQAREWAWEESKRKAPYHRWDEDRTRDFEMMTKVASKPAIIKALKPSRRDQLV